MVAVCCALAFTMVPFVPAAAMPAVPDEETGASDPQVTQTHAPKVVKHDFAVSPVAPTPRSATPAKGERLTVHSDVSGLATVGVTWSQNDMDDPANAPTIRLRYRTGDSWSRWVNLPATDEDSAKTGVSPSYYLGDADRVEATVTPKKGQSVRAQLITVDSGYAETSASSRESDGSTRQVRSGVAASGSLAAQSDPGVEESRARSGAEAITATGRIHTREEWWADGNPAMFWTPDRTGSWKGAIVHHTVDRNDYTQAEVPAMINGIYLLHNETRGWGDIGYQLIVDRFGGIWEGRDEGVPNQIVPASEVAGAQAVNFNYDTFGVALLGSYHLDVPPTYAQIASTAAAIAWEFQAMGLQPSDAWGTFEFRGLQQRITGHGDASHHDIYGSNETLCPGQQVWDRMGRIRDLVRSDMLGVPNMPLANVADGDYYIATTARDKAVAEIPNAVTADGALPRLHGWTGEIGQRFTFTRMADGSYLIVSKASGKALTVTDGVSANNAQISQQPIGYSPTDPNDPGQGGAAADKETAGDADPNDAPTKAQLWFLRDSGSGYYLQSALGEEVMDLSGGGAADGTVIALYGTNGAANQLWTLHPASNDVVADTNMSFHSGADIQQDGQVREYRGMATITRQDMAAFLYRWAGSPDFTPSAEDQARFTDVDWSTPFAKEIWWLADEGVSTGWKQNDGTYVFRGSANVTRQDMAAFMHRLIGTEGLRRSKSMSFVDVGWSTPHAEDILWLANTGVTTGWLREDKSREFRGLKPVVRQDMAAFLQRLAGVDDAQAQQVVRAGWGDGPAFFRDVTPHTSHAWSIWWMGLKGVSTGWIVTDADTEPDAGAEE